MHKWIHRLVASVAVAAMTGLCVSPSAAQTPTPVAHADLWGSASLGLASAGGRAAVGAQLALSRAVDQTMFTLRAAGETASLDSYAKRDYYDVAFLVGTRRANPRFPDSGNLGGTTASASAGIAWLGYVQSSTVSSPRASGAVPAIAFNADVMSHVRFVGLGLSLFGATGLSDRYIGVGLTLGIGKIH